MFTSDMEEPLTPSHLLLGRPVLSKPDHVRVTGDPDNEDFTPTPTQLNDRVKRLNGALNYFWTRWRNEYLLELKDTPIAVAHHTPLSQLGTRWSSMTRACLEDCGSLATSMNSLRAETASSGCGCAAVIWNWDSRSTSPAAVPIGSAQ